MKPIIALLTAALTLTASAKPPLVKQQKIVSSIPNPKIDYRQFMKIAAAAESVRESRRLTENQFIAAAS